MAKQEQTAEQKQAEFKQKVAEAELKIARAKIQLQITNPFFSFLVMFLKISPAKEGELPEYAGGGIDAQGNLIYKPEFVLGLSNKAVISFLCFPRDTIMAGRKYKPIQDIKIGDEVLNQDGKLERVKRTFINKTDSLIKIFPKYMLPITSTPNHPFLIRRYTLKSSTKRENRSITEQFKNQKS